jgi:hypothetical protein
MNFTSGISTGQEQSSRIKIYQMSIQKDSNQAQSLFRGTSSNGKLFKNPRSGSENSNPAVFWNLQISPISQQRLQDDYHPVKLQ